MPRGLSKGVEAWDKKHPWVAQRRQDELDDAAAGLITTSYQIDEIAGISDSPWASDPVDKNGQPVGRKLTGLEALERELGER